MVEYQKGNIDGVRLSENTHKIKAFKSGKITDINALELGKLSLSLGAGKVKIKDKIDYTVGIKLNKLVGDVVEKGDVLATLYVKNDKYSVDIEKIFTIK